MCLSGDPPLPRRAWRRVSSPHCEFSRPQNEMDHLVDPGHEGTSIFGPRGILDSNNIKHFIISSPQLIALDLSLPPDSDNNASQYSSILSAAVLAPPEADPLAAGFKAA